MLQVICTLVVVRKNDDIADLAPFLQKLMGNPTAHCHFENRYIIIFKTYREHFGFKLK